MGQYFSKKQNDALKTIKQNIDYNKYKTQLEEYMLLLEQHKDDYGFEIPDPPMEQKEIKLTRQEENELFDNIILPAFSTLVDHWIWDKNLMSDPNVKDLKVDCIGHLISRIEQYDYTKCERAFSFFNVICRNHILQYIDKNKKSTSLGVISRKEDFDASTSDENTLREETVSEYFVDNSYVHAGEVEEDTFYKFLLKEMAKIIVRCEDKKEKEFLKHVLHILETAPASDDIKIDNKRMFYISMRNLSNLRSREITKYLSKLKEYKKEIYEKYVGS